jgi:hypothetical protein
MQLFGREMLAIALLLLLVMANALVQPPCCVIKAIDARTGIVTARVKSSGRTFQFAVKSATTLGSLKIGQAVDANLTTKEVSLDGRTVCCRVISIGAPPAMAPCTLPVSLVVNPPYTTLSNQTPPVSITAEVATSVPPNATRYTFVATIPLNGHSYYPDPGTANAPTWIWTPKEAGDYGLTANVVLLVPAGPSSTEPARIPCGTATVNYHVSPQAVSTVTLTPNPASQSVPGNISVNANVSAFGITFNKFLFSYFNKFLFSYALHWGQPGPDQSGQATIETVNAYADWTLQPQPLPNLYDLKVTVDTYAFLTLIAEGKAIYGANTPNGGYIVLYSPGPCPTPASPADPTVPFGWLNPITSQNTTEAVSTPVGSANCSIAGYALNDILNNPQVRVRAINVSCINCHSSWGWQQKSTFCSAVPAFGHTQTDPTLSNLLQNWKSRGCPD